MIRQGRLIAVALPSSLQFIMLSLMNLVFNGTDYEFGIGVVSISNALVDQMKE